MWIGISVFFIFYSLYLISSFCPPFLSHRSLHLSTDNFVYRQCRNGISFFPVRGLDFQLHFFQVQVSDNKPALILHSLEEMGDCYVVCRLSVRLAEMLIGHHLEGSTWCSLKDKDKTRKSNYRSLLSYKSKGQQWEELILINGNVRLLCLTAEVRRLCKVD